MNSFVESIFRYKKEILAASIVITILFLMIYIQIKAKPKPDNLEIKLQQLCKEIPPDSKAQRPPMSITKVDRESYSIEFSSRVTFQQVKDYYSKLPMLKDWKISEESKYSFGDYRETRYLDIRNDGYQIELQTSNLSENDSEKNFSLTCSWKSY